VVQSQAARAATHGIRQTGSAERDPKASVTNIRRIGVHRIG
jgi:hypothetical protein